MKRLSVSLCALTLLATSIGPKPASAELIYGLVRVGNSNSLVTFDSADPSNLLSAKFLLGGGTLVGLDFRPATRQLYAMGAHGDLFRINLNTGITQQVGFVSNPSLNGVNFGFDFNPVIDRARVVSEVNKNLVMDPNTGALLVATDLAYGPADPNFGVDPNLVNSAYTNNVFNAVTTQLYGIDSGLNILVTQANNAGTLGTVGPLGVDIIATGGFDISGTTGVAYAAFQPASSAQSSLYTINLATGAATSLGVIDGGLVIHALTVAPAIPEPATLALAGMAVAAIPLLRRRG